MSPEAIDAVFGGDGAVSACRANARGLVRSIRRGKSSLGAVTFLEYDDGTLTAVDADPPRSIENAVSITEVR